MYAAAGGASLASRQARKRQQQQNTKNKILQQAKIDKIKAGGSPTPAHLQKSRQFHQLPSNYLRTPSSGESRKLSAASYAQSKLLLPIVEGDGSISGNTNRPHHQYFQDYTHHEQLLQHQQQHPGQLDLHAATTSSVGRPHSPNKTCRYERQHHHYLIKSATATLPLVSHAEDTPPETPLLLTTDSSVSKFQQQQQQQLVNDPTSIQNQSSVHMQLPIPHDSIIVTPATPLASPGHRPSTAPETTAGRIDPEISSPSAVPPSGQLERKCSFYRVQYSDASEYDEGYTIADSQSPSTPGLAMRTEIAYGEEHQMFFGLPNGGGKWADTTTCCEEDLCICDHIECAQGRAAWLERGRRCSVQDNNAASCHRRWVKRNRIQDSSLGGSSDDEDLLGVLRGPSSFANAFLYVGLGTVAIGLVIAFVGTGEKGFKTVELRLIGPSLIGIGLICCILRICFCICPSHCLSSSSRKARKKNGNKIDADHTTSLLRGETKRVSIAKGPNLHRFPLTHKTKSNNKMLNEGMEALRQIATTSLFLQNEQKTLSNRVVPIIKEPANSTAADAPLEMNKFDTTLNIYDISDDDDGDDEEDEQRQRHGKTSAAAANYAQPSTSSQHNQNSLLERTQSKLGRKRLSAHQPSISVDGAVKESDSAALMEETSLIDTANVTTPPSTLPPQKAADTMTIAIPSTSTADPPSPITRHIAFEIPVHESSPPQAPQRSLQTPPTLTLALPSSSGLNFASTSKASFNTILPGTAQPSYPSHSYHQNIHSVSHPPNPPPSAHHPPSIPSTTEPELVLSPAKLGQ